MRDASVGIFDGVYTFPSPRSRGGLVVGVPKFLPWDKIVNLLWPSAFMVHTSHILFHARTDGGMEKHKPYWFRSFAVSSDAGLLFLGTYYDLTDTAWERYGGGTPHTRDFAEASQITRVVHAGGKL